MEIAAITKNIVCSCSRENPFWKEQRNYRGSSNKETIDKVRTLTFRELSVLPFSVRTQHANQVFKTVPESTEPLNCHQRILVLNTLPSVQRRVSNLVKRLWWSIFAKTVNGFYPWTIFQKTLRYRCSSGLAPTRTSITECFFKNSLWIEVVNHMSLQSYQCWNNRPTVATLTTQLMKIQNVNKYVNKYF